MFKKIREIWLRIQAWFIWEQVKRDPVAMNAEPPEGLRDEIMKKIREKELQ